MNNPFTRLDSTKNPAAAPGVFPTRQKDFRVLVVDDTRASADALSDYLTAGGISARAVYNGSDALKEVKAWAPHCVVLDIAMPGLSGIGVAAMLKQRVSAGHVRLIAYTAFDSNDHRAEMSAIGFDAIWRKPADLTQLEAMILSLAESVERE